MNDVEEALQSLTGHNPKPIFHLRRELGYETDYMEINGHIFYKSNPLDHNEYTGKWCQGGGCEMVHPAFAEKCSCSTTMEFFDRYDRDYLDEQIKEWEEEHNWGIE